MASFSNPLLQPVLIFWFPHYRVQFLTTIAQPTFDPLSLSLAPSVAPASVSTFLLLRATQEELQRGAPPAAETPPLQRRPSVRAVISAADPSAGSGRPQVEPAPEAGEARGPDAARSSAEPTSPALGPRGPELAGLQAERDVVGLRERHQLREGIPRTTKSEWGWGRNSGTWLP